MCTASTARGVSYAHLVDVVASASIVKWGMRRLWAADGTARSADGRDVLSVYDVRRRGFDRDDMEAEFFEVSDLSVDENTSSAPAFTFSGR